MRRRSLLVLLVALLAGCVSMGPPSERDAGGFALSRQPVCEFQGDVRVPLLVLMAQAVPTASQLPCVDMDNLTSEWMVTDIFVRSGRARFALDSLRQLEQHAVVVVLERTCQFGKVTRVPSDHPGIQRYQEVTELRPGQEFRGAIYYLFPGGCVTYRLDFRGGEQARPLGDVVLALGFVPRDEVAAALRRDSDGRLSLDPPGGRR